METLTNRQYDRNAPSTPGDAGDLGGLAAAQGAMEAMLAAGDEIISKSLSEDSEAFLRASRQQGGQ